MRAARLSCLILASLSFWGKVQEVGPLESFESKGSRSFWTAALCFSSCWRVVVVLYLEKKNLYLRLLNQLSVILHPVINIQ